jgi:hypothetical protein
MDDLIPFLIVMLISIVGAIGSRKKKRDNAAKPSSLHFGRDDEEMPEWFKKFIPEEAIFPEEEALVDEPKPQPVFTASPPKPEPQPTVAGKYDQFSGFISADERNRLMKMEGERAIKSNAKPAEQEETAQPFRNKPVVFDRKGFDLRKAVIYNEILNRKYH